MVINGIDLFNAQPMLGMFPTKIREHGVSHGLAEVGYDIRLKQSVEFAMRVKNGEFQMCHRIVGGPPYLTGKPGRPKGAGNHTWKPGRFTIASAMEEFTMPNNLVGIVHDKSTWARRGLSVFNTVIEPKWQGFLTLELVYHGQEDLLIPAGAGIAQVVFHQLSSAAAYSGKYQNQEDKPVPAKFA